jgi:hypothetical protein
MGRHLCREGRGGRDGDGTHAIGAHWPCDVLDILLAEILERIRKLVANLVAHDTRDADAARLSQCLQPRRNVDAITVDVVAITDNVAKIDPDTEDDPLVLGVCALRSTIPRCSSTARRTASTTLGNSANMPSPVVFTMRPRCSLIFGSTS